MNTNIDMDEARAYYSWLYRYYGSDLDQELEPFLKARSQGPALKAIREAMFLSAKKVAEKLNISVPALSQLEKREEDGSITLNSLKAVARALDCELVYAIVPKSRKPLAATIWRRIYEVACRDKSLQKVKAQFKANAIAELANMVMNDPEFRRKEGWTERRIKTYDSRTVREKINVPKVRRLLDAE